MLYHGSKAGAFDLKTIVMECLTSMRRAGKSMCKWTQQLPNIVAPTMLKVVVYVLAVVCKRMQQQCWDLQCIVERIQPIRLCKPCVMRVRGPNNVGRAVQTDPTLLRHILAITEQKKCWELLAEKFDQFQTLRNNMQQSEQTDVTWNIQQYWELLANNVLSVCT